jgi:hypothetical protein
VSAAVWRCASYWLRRGVVIDDDDCAMTRTRIMYLEDKSDGLSGPARIGRVQFSKSGRTVYYGGRSFRRVIGFKHNHVDVETGEPFWISGPRRDGADRLYGDAIPTEIDEDVREEYWSQIRGSTS